MLVPMMSVSTTMPHADIESRGGTPHQNWCSEEGEPLRMGSTYLIVRGDCAPSRKDL